MAIVLDSYSQAVSSLHPVLHDLPGKVVGIDGRNGVGKTTFGRYLAWSFNISLLETDFYLPNPTELDFEIEAIRRLINYRLAKPRPIVVEGICLWALFDNLRLNPDFTIYCTSLQYPDGNILESTLFEYEAQYVPAARADMCIEIDHSDS